MGGTFSRRGQGPLVKEEGEGVTLMDTEKTEPPQPNGTTPQAEPEEGGNSARNGSLKTKPMFDDTQKNFVEDGRWR